MHVFEKNMPFILLCLQIFPKETCLLEFFKSGIFHSKHIFIATLKIFFQSGNVSTLSHLPGQMG